MENDIELLSEYLPEITENEEKMFKQFYDILCHFNKRINLVSRSSLTSAGRKHFSDSYMGIRLFDDVFKKDDLVYDFGSGNGFPGVISAIMHPEVNFLLVERDKRKSEFIRFLSEELGLKNISLHIGAASQLKENSVQIAMSRAMAPLPKMLLEVRSLVKPGGKIFLFKGDHWTTEFGNCPPQIFDLWDVELRGKYTIPSLDMDRFILECTRV